MKYLKNILILVATSFLFVNCNELEVDIAPVIYRLKVVDEQGNNLLNPARENAIDISEIIAQYQGNDYQCQTPTRAYKPHFNGLQLESHHSGEWILTFGEFSGTSDYEDEKLTILWGDGSSDIITYNRSVKQSTFSQNIKIKQEWLLNGKLVSTEHAAIIEIVK